MKTDSDTMNSRDKVKFFLLAVLIVGPLCAFLCGFAVSLVYSVVLYWAITMIFAMFGAITACFCVLLSYRTLLRYNKAVAIIYCTTGTLVIGLIPSLVVLSSNPLSWPAGLIGYLVGLSLLNFNIGVHRVDAFCTHVYHFFVKPRETAVTRERGVKRIAKGVGMFLLAIFIVGPFFGYLCGVAVGAVEVFSLFFTTHIRIAILYALSAILFIALSHHIVRRYKPGFAIAFCLSWTVVFSLFPSFLFYLGYPYFSPVEPFALNEEATFFPNTWPLGAFGYWAAIFCLHKGIGTDRSQAFYDHVAAYFSRKDVELAVSQPE